MPQQDLRPLLRVQTFCVITALLLLTFRSQGSDSELKSLAAGASGYLRKPMEPAELLEAIREGEQGGAP